MRMAHSLTVHSLSRIPCLVPSWTKNDANTNDDDADGANDTNDDGDADGANDDDGGDNNGGGNRTP